MTNNKTYEGRACAQAGGCLRTSDSVVNFLEGIVHSQHPGLIHSTVRIHAGRRIDLRVKLSIDDDRCFFPGQAVIAMIPVEAVLLEADLFRRSR